MINMLNHTVMKRMVRILILLVIFFFTRFNLIAQSIGIGTDSPDSSAALEIFSPSRGLLIPRLTTAQRNTIINPAHTLIIFNVDNFCIEIYDTTQHQWLQVSCPRAFSPSDTCLLPVIDSIVGNMTLCLGDTITYFVYGHRANTYIWQPPLNWIFLGGRDTAQFIVGDSGTLFLSLCNKCGCVSDSIEVLVDVAPTSVSILGSYSICISDTLTLIILDSGATSYIWQVPSGWTIIGHSNSDTLVAVPSSTGSFTFSAQACNGCGCSPSVLHTVTVGSNALNPDVSIQGPSSVCLPDTVIFRAPHLSGSIWQWWYPSTWQVLAQGGDSIVLIPDTTDGNVIVQICDTTGCACDMDTLFVTTDTCISFCIAIGGPNDDYGESIIQTTDGGYAIAGYTNSFGQGDYDMYIVKIDANGNLQWTRTIGGPNDDRGYSIIQSNDSGYIVVGYTSSFGQGRNDVYIVKLDVGGNIQWTKTVGGPNHDHGESIIQTDDDGYAIVGSTNSFGQGERDVYVVKLNATGNIQWTRTIGGTKFDFGRSIVQTSNKGFIISGITVSYSNSGGLDRDVYIVKLDSLGNLQWTRTIGGPNFDYGNSIIQTTDTGYLAVGLTQSPFGSGGPDVYVVKLDLNGNVQWTKAIGGNSGEIGMSVRPTNDGEYIVAGYTYSFGQGSNDIYLIKLDENGNIQWTRTIGGPNYDYGQCVAETNDRGYAVTGYTNSFGYGGWDIYIIKLDANGNLAPCPGGCQVSSGGVSGAGGITGTGGIVGSGGTTSSGGVTGSGGTLLKICP